MTLAPPLPWPPAELGGGNGAPYTGVNEELSLHPAAPTAAAAKAANAARLSRIDGKTRSGAPATSAVTTASQKGHVASLRRMWRLQPVQLIRLAMRSPAEFNTPHAEPHLSGKRQKAMSPSPL